MCSVGNNVGSACELVSSIVEDVGSEDVPVCSVGDDVGSAYELVPNILYPRLPTSSTQT